MTPKSQPSLYRRNGWVRGLIHFHTRFSDGWATIRQAAELAVDRGFDFLIVTDHLQNLKLVSHRRIEDYIEACDQATSRVGIPVIPGGEIEVHWDRLGHDRSEAHTIVFSVRELVKDPTIFDWKTPGETPYWLWRDNGGEHGTITAVQRMLTSHGIPRAASHQFQHSYLSTKRGEHSDYRYDLKQIPDCDFLDFFYSGIIDAVHEPEDIKLLVRYNRPPTKMLKAVYASCDYHVGPEVIAPGVENFLRSVPFLHEAYRWLFTTVASLALRWIWGDPEQAAFPLFAGEQLSHATYVHVGQGNPTEDIILQALRSGRTCVTRGTADFAHLHPPPDLAVTNHVTSPAFQLELLRTWRPKFQRPHHVIVLRDGVPIYIEPYDIRSHTLSFTWFDKEPLSGEHLYQLYVPSKFLCSPIKFASQ